MAIGWPMVSQANKALVISLKDKNEWLMQFLYLQKKMYELTGLPPSFQNWVISQR